jgi:hypothetical protein
MTRQLTTADVGLAVADFLIDRQIEAIDWSAEDLAERDSDYHEAYFVDVSDPHNPIIHTDSGSFQLTITKVEPARAASNRPGDQAAIYAEETGVDYATALVICNMD